MRTAAIGSLIGVIAAVGLAAGQDDQTRQIVAEEFLKARPAPSKPASGAKPKYVAAGPRKSAGVTPGAVQLGVTLWRLRAAQGSDEGARLLVQEGGDLTAESIDPNAPLAVGDRVRLTLESPQAGALYVIDREVYGDGTMSDPYLIFPTTRTRGGANAVRSGRLIDIPDQHDRPNYFTVRPSRPGQTGELLTIIVSPTPIAEVSIGDQPLKLSPELVGRWETSWSAPTEQFVQQAGTHVWTRQEQAAAADAARLLTQDDPAPQTIFRIAAKKGSPVLVNLRLPYAASERGRGGR